MDLKVFKVRFREFVRETNSGVDTCARRAHQGLAQFYGEKLTVVRADARLNRAAPRAVLKEALRHG